MELLGLAIVVVLVSIGMMYLLVFMVGKPPKLIHAKFAEKEISQNFLGAMLRTQSKDCRGLSLGDLLQDCANYDASGGSVTCSNGLQSCAYVQLQLEELFKSTLYRWQYDYRFRVFRGTEAHNPLIPQKCTSADPPDSCAADQRCCPLGQTCVFPLTSGTVLEGSCSAAQDGAGMPVDLFNPQGRCTDRSQKETPGLQPLPLDVGTLTVMLEICRG